MNVVFMLMPPKIVEHFRAISNKINQAQQCFFCKLGTEFHRLEGILLLNHGVSIKIRDLTPLNPLSVHPYIRVNKGQSGKKNLLRATPKLRG